MNSILNSRPHFFTGQLIDYRDFNLLAKRPDELISAMMRHFCPGGGLIGTPYAQAEPLELRLNGKMEVIVEPGVALLPDGQFLVLREPRVLDLAPYAFDKEAKVVQINIRNVRRGDRHYVDPEDSTISGFRSECFDAEIFYQKIESNCPGNEEALEIARVMLFPQAQELRGLDSSEQWKSVEELMDIVRQQPHVGIVDLRHRRVLAPHCANPFGLPKLIELRKTFLLLHSAIDRLSRTYMVPDFNRTEDALALVQAEVLSQPFQAQKLSFLLALAAKKLSEYLEHLLLKAERSRSDFNRDLTLKAIEVLQGARNIQLRPQQLFLEEFVQASQILGELVHFADSHFSLSQTLREALATFRTVFLERADRISLAARVFEKVDQVVLGHERRWSTSSSDFHRRKQVAAFQDGTEFTLNGVFIKEGRFDVTFNPKYSDRPLVIMFHQYFRRSGSQLSFYLNGKSLETQGIENGTAENCWLNHALVVAPELIVSGDNQLSIHVDKTDLDFGFFGADFYQPVIQEDSL